MTRPGYVVNISIVWEQLEQLLGVDPIIGGEGGQPHVPQGDHAVVGTTEQPGRLTGT